jgi:hypothetical protein
VYAATYKEMGDILQPSSMESGQEDALQAEKTNAERETETLKMGTAQRNRRGHLQLNTLRTGNLNVKSPCRPAFFNLLP